jgi:hypothetical protein
MPPKAGRPGRTQDGPARGHEAAHKTGCLENPCSTTKIETEQRLVEIGFAFLAVSWITLRAQPFGAGRAGHRVGEDTSYYHFATG